VLAAKRGTSRRSVGAGPQGKTVLGVAVLSLAGQPGAGAEPGQRVPARAERRRVWVKPDAADQRLGVGGAGHGGQGARRDPQVSGGGAGQFQGRPARGWHRSQAPSTWPSSVVDLNPTRMEARHRQGEAAARDRGRDRQDAGHHADLFAPIRDNVLESSRRSTARSWSRFRRRPRPAARQVARGAQAGAGRAGVAAPCRPAGRIAADPDQGGPRARGALRPERRRRGRPHRDGARRQQVTQMWEGEQPLRRRGAPGGVGPTADAHAGLLVATPNGAYVPLSEIANFRTVGAS